MAEFFVTLKKLTEQLPVEVVYAPCDVEDIRITSPDINRPSLVFAGFTEYFDPLRVQLCGKSELSYLESFSNAEQQESVERFFSLQPAVVVVTRGLEIPQMFRICAEKYAVPLLHTNESTSSFSSAVISLLSVELAPRMTRHGVLVEVYGEGVLLLGESGVGKSETAIELLKRGHRLIADDSVELRRVSNRTIVGTAPENIRYFIELRGVGIINVRRIFGMGSVKLSERVDMVIELEPWVEQKSYNRLGVENDYMEIFDLHIPKLTIPIKPGRNLAVIIEVAAMNNRQKKMGFNAGKELLSNLGMVDDLSGHDELEI